MTEAPTLLLRMRIAGFEYLLRQSLQGVLVEVVPFMFQLVITADEGASGRGPGV